MSTAPWAERQWFISQRWQEFAGESRANLLRIIAIGGFYSIHLLHYYQGQASVLELGPASPRDAAFHVAVTALAVAWTMVALSVQLCLRQRVFPAGLKYLSTGCDLVLLTAVLVLADGPRSPLIVGYFLILALAALRLSLPLVRMATVGCLAGYLALLAVARWPESFGRGAVDLRVPRYEQLMTLLALALAGVLLGQVLRRARITAEDYAERVRREPTG